MTSLDKLTEISRVTDSKVDNFRSAGFESLEDLSDLTEDDLEFIDGVGTSKLDKIYRLLDREGVKRAERDENYLKFRGLLEELFQFESADLDFGIYRIMNERRNQIEKFLDEELNEKVQKELEEFKDLNIEDSKKKFEEAKNDIRENFPQWTDEQGNIVEEKIPQDAEGIAQTHKQQYFDAKNELEKADIGEDVEAAVYQDLYRFFKRYYKDGDFIPQRRAAKQEKYSIPYNGEEVKLHWANKDQYFVKTGEHFKDYKFNKDSYEIEFKIHDAHVEKNNKKGDEKFFVLRGENPVEQDERFLTVHFEYRPLTEEDYQKYNLSESSTKPTYRKEIRKSNEKEILSKISNELEEVLDQEVDNPRSESTILRKHLKNYRTKNENDYFIHKDLGGFLEQELDFYLKNEVFSWKEMTGQNMEMPLHVRARLNAIENIAKEIIEFIAEIEDYQKKLFEKKKFVVNTDYCLNLNEIPAELADKIPEKALESGEENSLVDTQDLGADLRSEVVEEVAGREDGEFMHSENWQALQLLKEKYRGKVSCIYIDPPFNTGTNEFLYKNNFLDSSWISLMRDRIELAKEFLAEDGFIFVRIDHHGNQYIRQLLDSIFGEENFRNEIQVKRTHKNVMSTREVSSLPVITDSLFLYSKNRGSSLNKVTKKRDEVREGFWRHMNDSAGEGPPRTFYGKEMEPPEGKHWKFSQENIDEKIENDNLILECRNCRYKHEEGEWAGCPECGEDDPNPKYWVEPAETQVLDTNWTDIKGYAFKWDFPTENAEELLKRALEAGSEEGDLVMDFFAGSGTTQAVAQKLDRKWIGAEMGEYFQDVTLNRLKKTLQGYKSGIHNRDDVNYEGRGIFKYSRLEQYEDSLNNLESNSNQTEVGEFTANKLDYFLNFEIDGKPLLDLKALKQPFQYQMNIHEGNESHKQKINLVETFNYLLGLKIETNQKIKRLDRKYKIIRGTKDEQEITVIWRPVNQSDGKKFYEEERDFLESEVLRDEDRIYINYDSSLEAKSIEKKFEEKLWSNQQ